MVIPRSAVPPLFASHAGAGAGGGGGELLREQMRASDLAASRKIPSSRGWRKLVYRMSFRTINTGESPDERELRRLTAMVRTPLRGTYSIVILGGKGGTGKTTAAVAIGSTFASLRNDKVVAIDADPAQAANLAARIDPTASNSFRDVIADQQLLRYSDMRSHVGQNDAVGLDVLASNAYVSGRDPVDSTIYSDAYDRLERFYSVLISDCGVDLVHPVMAGVLARANAVVMVASAVPDGAEGAAKQMDWLQEAGYRQLASRMVLVINHIRGHTSRKDRKQSRRLVATLVERFGRWLPPERIFVVPFDRHIAMAGLLELDQLKPRTRRRFLEITAELATGFSATTDRP
ncbi:MinD/ParA family ATP-binding protein [Mycobacterium kansasii]